MPQLADWDNISDGDCSWSLHRSDPVSKSLCFTGPIKQIIFHLRNSEESKVKNTYRNTNLEIIRLRCQMSLDIHGCHCYLNVRWRARQHWVPHHALEMLLQLGCDGLQRLNAKKLWKYSLILTLCVDPIFIMFAWISVCNCCNHTGHFLIQNPCLLLLPDLKLSGSKTQHPEIRESRGYGWLGARTSRTIYLIL